MLKISENKAIEIMENCSDMVERIREFPEIQEPLEFLSVLTTTTTVRSGLRTESSEIDVPVELLGKKFKITDIWINGIVSTGASFNVSDNLLVGLLIGGKSLLMGSKQTFNGINTTLDMLPVPVSIMKSTENRMMGRKAHYKLLSELFNNIKKLKIIYSHKSTSLVHYLIYLTIRGVIL